MGHSHLNRHLHSISRRTATTTFPCRRRHRTLLLTIDAFGTLFHPRRPVAEQYAATAHSFGLSPTSITPEALQSAFKQAFKAQIKKRPNYGREDVLRGRYGGPRQWWEAVIRASFTRVMSEREDNWELPGGMVECLVNRFAGREGYALFEDVVPFMERMRQAKIGGGLGIFHRILLGVISNSDDRVPAVLKDLGLRVGDLRADQGVSSMELPGFEERCGGGQRENDVSRNQNCNAIDDLDLIVTSYEAGEEKPNRLIFDVAERQARKLIPPDAAHRDMVCIHVGDDYEKDYRAALEAGWDSYFLPRDGGMEGQKDAKTLTSLMDLVGELEGYEITNN